MAILLEEPSGIMNYLSFDESCNHLLISLLGENDVLRNISVNQ